MGSILKLAAALLLASAACGGAGVRPAGWARPAAISRSAQCPRSRVLARNLHPAQEERERTETPDWGFPPLPRIDAMNGARDEGSASSPKQKESGDGGGAVALGALASSALISEAIQVVGTGGLVYLAKEFTHADDLTTAVSVLSDYFQSLGWEGYLLYAAIQIFLQVIPVASAFVLTVSAGVVFGSVGKATALVAAASTTSAAIAFAIARFALRDKILEVAGDNKAVATIDKALDKADLATSMLVIILLRSSPLLPFPWASYLFGLSTVPFSAYIVGTLAGTLPAIFAYVNAGQLSSEILLSGTPPSWLVQFGLAATLGAVVLIGNLASDALKDLDVDLED